MKDEYAIALQRQSEGLPCWRCNSVWGHFIHCPLINGGVKYTDEQRAYLQRRGFKEDEGWGFRPENGGLASRHATWAEFCISNRKHREALAKAFAKNLSFACTGRHP
jgi:hypothetical protein